MIPEVVFSATLLSFFDPVRRYLDDPSVTEVMNAKGSVRGNFAERRSLIFSSVKPSGNVTFV